MTTVSDNKQNSAAVKGGILYVLIAVVIVQFIYPFAVSESVVPLIIYQLMYVSLFGAGIWLARDNKVHMILLVFFAFAWLISGVVYAFNQALFWANIMGYVFIFGFQATITYILFNYIFSVKTVTRDVLYAACAVYFLLGALFVPIFGTLETLAWFSETPHHAISDSAVDPNLPVAFQTLIYFSYTNLTTLGYGDVLPQTFWARSIATLEAAVGVLYLAIIMARLVGLYASEETVAELHDG